MNKRPSLGSVFLTVVIDLMGFGIVLPLLPLYGDRYGASELTLGLLFSSFSAMQFLSAPLWGRLSDKHGRRPVILLGLVGSMLGYGLFAVAPLMPDAQVLVWLFIARIVAGVFGGTLAAAQAYIADVTPPEERGRGMALIGVAFGLGFTIGPAIGGLGFSLHECAPGLIAAAFSLGAFLFAWSRLGEPERQRSDRKRTWLDLETLGNAFRTQGLGALLLIAAGTVTCFALFESILSLLGKERFAYTEKDIGWFFSYLGLCSMISQGVIVRRLLKKVGERPLLLAGPVLIILGFAGLALLESEAALWAVVPLPVLGMGMIMPSAGSLISRRTDGEMQGAVLGVNQSLQSVARIVGPVVGLGVFAHSQALPFWIGAAVMAAVFLLGMRLRGEQIADRY